MSNDPTNPFFGLHYGDKPLAEPDIAVTADGNAVVARHPTRETHDCMFHDEGITDAPCICGGEQPSGSHEIVQGEVVQGSRVNLITENSKPADDLRVISRAIRTTAKVVPQTLTPIVDLLERIATNIDEVAVKIERQ